MSLAGLAHAGAPNEPGAGGQAVKNAAQSNQSFQNGGWGQTVRNSVQTTDSNLGEAIKGVPHSQPNPNNSGGND